MTERPLVSVIIPTYNRADFLVEAIQSVLKQAYTRYEILIADDGSTDDTMERVNALSGPIRYLHLKHTGFPGVARNQALKVASGSLIAFLDSDDKWRDDKLSKQVPLFLEDDRLGLVYSDCTLFSDDGLISGRGLKPYQLHLDSVFDELLKGCFIHPSTVVIQKKLFDQLGLFDIRFTNLEECYFWLRATLHTPAQAVPEPLVYVRRNLGSLSHQLGSHDWQNAIIMFKHLLAHETLTFRQRLIVRRTLSRFCTHVGLEYSKSGQDSLSQSYFWRSILWNPLQRRAWLALFHHLFPSWGHG